MLFLLLLWEVVAEGVVEGVRQEVPPSEPIKGKTAASIDADDDDGLVLLLLLLVVVPLLLLLLVVVWWV